MAGVAGGPSNGSGTSATGSRAITLDDIDRRLLDVLADDARVPNNVLAERVGIAPSTCSLRLRRLVSSGVVRGFHADLDPAAVGRPIQAMIAVRLQPAARADIGSVAPRLAALPGVLNVFFLAGDDDFLIQVALPSPDALRAFVIDHLSASREFTSTETSLVFEHVRGSASTWDVRSV
ncbi:MULTISPECIES: Lrp/AsnC family transcriptional regulator [unclassified Aeromicrobium]|jgi:DNA-binding Lrp family transcriptional regulator|uniref:Lrp/AsnC family transcriptional regulator n=1 Tax=unclassified Aeromicrobium TaxID=2633570 RepID=UPI000A47CB91|nr:MULTISPECIES: Lrp/AsnC family transcriptional regulator [unclassified Aeromicrobium]